MLRIRILAVALIIAICVGSFASCADKAVEPWEKTYFEYFDTFARLSSYAEDSKEQFEQNCELVRAELEKYHRLFDIYYEYSGVVNLKTLNKSAAVSAVKVDREIVDFLLYAKEMYTLTEGKMNVAMGSVLGLWHECRSDAEGDPEGARLPDAEALSEAAKHTSIDSVIVDAEECTVYFSDPELKLDVGALGKGYAVEKTAELLRSRGVSSYVLNVGGNICAIGQKSDGEGWTTGITDPDKESGESFAARVLLEDTSCVTSGNYERYYTVGGVRYHHIIDPDTNMPTRYFASVSVIARNSALSDALSTALFCMSYEDGLRILSKLDGVEVLWIYEDGEQKMTDGFKDILINDK